MSNPGRIIAGLACVAAGVVAGSLLLGGAMASDAGNDGDVTPRFEVNERGQTFGSSAGVAHADEPDLIEAIATNGKIGYVEKADLYGPEPESPEAAAANLPEDRTIAVYESDGVTVIGEFIVQGGDDGVEQRVESPPAPDGP
jgi:hypothetical protein